MIVIPVLIFGLFVLAIVSFCIKQKYYEDDMKKTASSYRHFSMTVLQRDPCKIYSIF